MTEEECRQWENSYREDGEIYRLTVEKEDELEKLDDMLALPLVLSYQMSAMEEGAFKEAVAKQSGMDTAVLDSMSIEQIGASMGIELKTFARET